MPLIEAILPIRGQRGRSRRRPERIYADRAYDHDKYRKLVRGKRIQPQFRPARRRTRLRTGRPPLGR
jgi:hypothetical protein